MTRRAVRTGLVALAVVAALVPTTPASAATIIPTVLSDDVTVNGNCTLREAIRAANMNAAVDMCVSGSGADIIQLVAGSYSLSVEGDGENAAATGDLDVVEDLTISGAGAAATTIDGQWASNPERILEVLQAGTDLTLSGITVRDGDLGGAGSGGGILVATDTATTITDAVLTNGVASFGGGISNDGTLTMLRVVVSGNRAGTRGGGIYNNGSMSLTDVAITGNQVLAGGFDGGAMYSYTGSMTNVTISGNSVPVDAGGAELDGTHTLTNVTISGNSANEDGGGVEVDGQPQFLNNVTITGNTADADANGSGNGGGLYAHTKDDAMLKNSIVAGNSDRGGQMPDCGQNMPNAFLSGGHNLIGSTTGCMFTSGTGDLLNVDPKLGGLADNGGPTMTHALLPGSPAIDAGGTDCAATDQRGLMRNCDIGAYELVLCGKVPINRIGTEGNDTLTGTAAPDGFLAGGGDDKATGLGGADAACLGPGNDTASGGGGKDLLKGEQGKDKLKGQGGADRLKGGPNKDTCIGGGGRDKAACETEKSI